MISYIALAVGLLGLLMAWVANRNHANLKERLAEANSRVYKLRREMQETQETAQRELMFLKFDLLKLQDDLKVTPEMTIGEITAVYPQAQQVMAGFHLGGCASCLVDEEQSLADAVVANGQPLEPVLVALNTLAAEGSNGHNQEAEDQLKRPNVQLHL